MGRRILGIVGSVVLAAVGTVLLVAYVNGAEQRALAGEETVEVLVVRDDIPRATAVEDLGDRVTVERVPVKVRAVGSVQDLTELEGQVAAVDLVPGEQLVRSRFTNVAELQRTSDVEVPDGLQELTISLAPQRAVGGRVQPGDTVAVFASFDLEDGRTDEEIAAAESESYTQRLSETTKLILHKVLVSHVQVEQLPPTPGEDEEAGRNAPDLAPTGNLLITLAVDVAAAERIVFAAEHGLIWLSSQPDSATEDGSLLRTPRNIYDD
jgi:pilus assembly protein CpaB